MIKSIFKIICFVLIFLQPIAAQIQISLPDTTEDPDQRITIPIKISDLSGLGVRSYNIKIKFDQSILKLRDVDEKGTLSDTWTWDVDYDLDDDGLSIDARGWFTLTGKGTLLNLKFKVEADEGFTKLEMDPVRFNNGNLQVDVDNGSFRVYVEKSIKFVKQGDGYGKVSINGKKFNIPYETNLVQGLTYKIQAHPENNSSFDKWSGAFNTSQNPYQYTVDQDAEIRTYFNLKKYSVIISIEPEGYGITNGMGIYEFGETAFLSATPYGGKEFKGWSIEGEMINEDPEFELDITEDVSIVANFVNLLLEINAESNPMTAGQILGAGYYYHDEVAVLEAVGNENWQFDFWSENGEFISSDSVLSLTVADSRSLIANFSQLTDISANSILVNEYYLQNPYPNPFNPSTTFKFGLPELSEVNFYVLDLTGKVIEILVDSREINSGIFERTFTADNLSSGVYFYFFEAAGKMTGKNFVKKGKFILLK